MPGKEMVFDGIQNFRCDMSDCIRMQPQSNSMRPELGLPSARQSQSCAKHLTVFYSFCISKCRSIKRLLHIANSIAFAVLATCSKRNQRCKLNLCLHKLELDKCSRVPSCIRSHPWWCARADWTGYVERVCCPFSVRTFIKKFDMR